MWGISPSSRWRRISSYQQCQILPVEFALTFPCSYLLLLSEKWVNLCALDRSKPEHSWNGTSSIRSRGYTGEIRQLWEHTHLPVRHLHSENGICCCITEFLHCSKQRACLGFTIFIPVVRWICISLTHAWRLASDFLVCFEWWWVAWIWYHPRKLPFLQDKVMCY